MLWLAATAILVKLGPQVVHHYLETFHLGSLVWLATAAAIILRHSVLLGQTSPCSTTTRVPLGKTTRAMAKIRPPNCTQAPQPHRRCCDKGLPCRFNHEDGDNSHTSWLLAGLDHYPLTRSVPCSRLTTFACRLQMPIPPPMPQIECSRLISITLPPWRYLVRPFAMLSRGRGLR